MAPTRFIVLTYRLLVHQKDFHAGSAVPYHGVDVLLYGEDYVHCAAELRSAKSLFMLLLCTGTAREHYEFLKSMPITASY